MGELCGSCRRLGNDGGMTLGGHCCAGLQQLETQRARRSTEGTEMTETTMAINDITGTIIGSAIKVHTALGPGLLESAYHACLDYELRLRGVRLANHVALPVTYEGFRVDLGYR